MKGGSAAMSFSLFFLGELITINIFTPLIFRRTWPLMMIEAFSGCCAQFPSLSVSPTLLFDFSYSFHQILFQTFCSPPNSQKKGPWLLLATVLHTSLSLYDLIPHTTEEGVAQNGITGYPVKINGCRNSHSNGHQTMPPSK